MKRLVLVALGVSLFALGCSSETLIKKDLPKTNPAAQQKKSEPDEIRKDFPGDYLMGEDYTSLASKNLIDRDYEKEYSELDQSPNFSTHAQIQLENKYGAIWDEELNAIYNKLQTKLKENDKKLLQESQRGWLQYHQKEEDFVWDAIVQDNLGTQGEVQMAATYKNRIRNRTLQLVEYYYILGGEVQFKYKGRK